MLDKDYLIVHCAATPPSFNGDSRDIHRWHLQQGWRGCGYNEVITRSGERQTAERGYPTRALDDIPAHVGDCGRGWNSRSIGICLIGGVDKNGVPEMNFTPEQFASLRDAINDYVVRYPKITKDNIIGHRDLIKKTGAPYKACPSFSVQEWMLLNMGLRNPTSYDETRKSPSELPLARNPVVGPGPGLPAPKLSAQSHIVRAGETLWSIANLYGVPLRDLVALNSIANAAKLAMGAMLILSPQGK